MTEGSGTGRWVDVRRKQPRGSGRLSDARPMAQPHIFQDKTSLAQGALSEHLPLHKANLTRSQLLLFYQEITALLTRKHNAGLRVDLLLEKNPATHTDHEPQRGAACPQCSPYLARKANFIPVLLLSLLPLFFLILIATLILFLCTSHPSLEYCETTMKTTSP